MLWGREEPPQTLRLIPAELSEFTGLLKQVLYFLYIHYCYIHLPKAGSGLNKKAGVSSL